MIFFILQFAVIDITREPTFRLKLGLESFKKDGQIPDAWHSWQRGIIYTDYFCDYFK